MSRAGRLAGALLAETEGRYFLVGNTKEPCDFAAAGFEPPEVVDAIARPWVRLSAARSPFMAPPWLRLELEGDALPRLLAERFLIERNGSVSERLWRLVVESGGASQGASAPGPSVDARWLADVPAAVWRIVRERVLSCS